MANFIGKVGKAPELKSTAKGNVLEFRFAVTTGFGENRTDQWYDVSVWDEKLIESTQKSVMVGASVVIDGPVKSREYNGKTYQQIQAYRVGLIDWCERTPWQGGQSAAPAKAAPAAQEEMPF